MFRGSRDWFFVCEEEFSIGVVRRVRFVSVRVVFEKVGRIFIYGRGDGVGWIEVVDFVLSVLC